MIISCIDDFREAARRRLPRFLFDYIDGGAGAEQTLGANLADLAQVRLKQRVLAQVENFSLETEWFGRRVSLPVVLGPVGMTGMFWRRGEEAVARAAATAGVPYAPSTVSICALEEIAAQSSAPLWFQLYVLKDRGFMRSMLERAREVGVTTLVFTVDLPVPGPRWRDAHSGLAGPLRAQRRLLQAVGKPAWTFDVGLRGRPHDLGNISTYLGRRVGLEDYIGWLHANMDPSIGWTDLEWLRDFWRGPLIIKGVLTPEDAREAVRFGADAIVVSNHGGRQLDGAASTARALPKIKDAIGDDLPLFVDSGVRSGLDVVRMLALGAKGVLLGRAQAFALGARGERGVTEMLEMIAQEMRVTMTLTGVSSVEEIDTRILDDFQPTS